MCSAMAKTPKVKPNPRAKIPTASIIQPPF